MQKRDSFLRVLKRTFLKKSHFSKKFANVLSGLCMGILTSWSSNGNFTYFQYSHNSILFSLREPSPPPVDANGEKRLTPLQLCLENLHRTLQR